MAKNNKQDFMGCDTVGYKDIKLLDIQPLHPGMTVMVVDTDGDDNVVMRDCVETGNSYCLALVEENGERAVYPFALSTFYGVDARATVIPIRHCPGCGKRMRPHMEEGDTGTLHYTCGRCGWMEHSWLEEDELAENCEEDKHMMGNFRITYGTLEHEDNYRESLEKHFEGAEIQQVMPIPENMAVMLVELNADDEPVCCDSRDTNWPTGLAVVKLKDGVGCYPIDLVEGDLKIEAQLVNRHKCGKCGREMKILLKPGQEGFEAKYRCESCGRTVKLNPDGSEEDETNE